MFSNTTIFVVLGAYIILCFLGIYYCLMADPDDSKIAYFFQVTIPSESWKKVSSLVGPKRMDVVQNMMDRAMVLVYFVVVGGCWHVIFWYYYPWLLFNAPTVSNIHAWVGVIVFIGCFVCWALANSSRPGYITARSFRRYDHYPYDNLLFVPNKRCDTTNLPRIPRSKYDRLKYKCIVPRYDHFCGWTFNTYGEENYRWFLLFLTQHVFMCMYGTYVTASLFYDEIQQKKLFQLTFFDRATGETIPASTYVIFQYMFARKTLECCVLTIMVVMGIALSFFLGYHIYLTSTGQTTNENSKWGDIKQWYKKEQKRYNRAVKDGKVTGAAVVRPSSQTTPVSGTGGQQQRQQRQQEESATSSEKSALLLSGAAVADDDDGDVTCTPSIGGPSKGTGGTRINDIQSTAADNNSISTSATSSLSHKNDDEEEYIDPGPVPKNIYNKGFVENWKEVIFPLSLRKDALTLGGYTKVRPRPGPPPPPQQQKQQQQRPSSDNHQQQQESTPAVPVVMEGDKNNNNSSIKTKST